MYKEVYSVIRRVECIKKCRVYKGSVECIKKCIVYTEV